MELSKKRDAIMRMYAERVGLAERKHIELINHFGDLELDNAWAKDMAVKKILEDILRDVFGVTNEEMGEVCSAAEERYETKRLLRERANSYGKSGAEPDKKASSKEKRRLLLCYLLLGLIAIFSLGLVVLFLLSVC